VECFGFSNCGSTFESSAGSVGLEGCSGSTRAGLSDLPINDLLNHDGLDDSVGDS
jgi:hypothetical protein